MGDRRYLLCKNEDQARKNREDREAIAAALKDALRAGDKSLVGNKGYRRFLQTTGEHFTIDQDKLEEEERYDGKWLLTTNTELAARDVTLKYKQLWMVEDIFRSMKSLLELVPLTTSARRQSGGMCSARSWRWCCARNCRAGWSARGGVWIIRDLDRLHEVEMSIEGKSYVVRTETKGTVGKVFQACGVALPPTLHSAEAS